jgi:hypothetical protein
MPDRSSEVKDYGLKFNIPSPLHRVVKENFWNMTEIVMHYLHAMEQDESLRNLIKTKYQVGKEYICDKEVCIKFNPTQTELLEMMAQEFESKSALLRSILAYHCMTRAAQRL